MTRTSFLARACAVCAGSVVLALAGAGAGQASSLPEPLSSVVGSTTQAVGEATSPLPPAPLPTSLPTSLPAPVPTQLPDPRTTAVETTGPGAGRTSGGTVNTRPAAGPTAGVHPGGTPSASSSGRPGTAKAAGPGPTPSEVRATTDVATVCLIPTGSTSPAFGVDLSVVDQDLASPFVQQFPQVFTPCPPRTVAPRDDTVVAADASARDLVGACVRLTRAGLPSETTVVVLDKNLIQELSRVGLPLDQLLVPCPDGVASSGGPTGGSPNATAALAAGGDAASPTAGHSGLLAYTGARVLPAVALAALLLTLGWFLLRTSARLAPLARRG